MDQIEDSTADHHHRRRRKQPTKIRCFLGCFGGGGAAASEEDEKLPRRKFKSINQSRWFSSCFKSRSEKSPKRTVPVESQSSTDEKVNNEKGRRVLGRSKSKSNKMIDELPVKGEGGIMNQPPVAGDVLHEKANNKKRSGKGILMRNSKSMNHIEVLEPIQEEAATPTSLRKSKSAKITTTINQPSGGDSQLIRAEEISLSISQSQSVVADDQQEVSGRGRGEEDGDDDENSNKVKKREEKKKKGSIDRVVGISIIVMVLVIMGVWGKLCAILCSAAWLYFYPLLLGGADHNNNGTQHLDDVVAQTKDSTKSLQIVHGNPHCQKKEGCP